MKLNPLGNTDIKVSDIIHYAGDIILNPVLKERLGLLRERREMKPEERFAYLDS